MIYVYKIIILAIAAVFVILGYACFLASITSDEKTDRTHRDYEKWKKKRKGH